MTKVMSKNSLQSPVFSKANKLARILWMIVYHSVFKWSPVPFFGYRRMLLRLFGANVGVGVNVYPTAMIWLPSNLTLHAGSSVGPHVKIYNQGEIVIGKNSIISQYSYLCASTHDYNDPLHPLILCPITIRSNVWVCADAFVGPGVTLNEGCVVGARAVVNRDATSWDVYAGNPARVVSKREQF